MNNGVYRYVKEKNIDTGATRRAMKVFLIAYRSIREKLGMVQEPEKTPVPMNQEIKDQEYNELHHLYSKGMAAIQHQNPMKTSRRKEAFYYRYVLGRSPAEIAMSLQCSLRLIEIELAAAVIQFCEALEIVVKSSK